MAEMRWQSHSHRFAPERGSFIGTSKPASASGFRPPAWMNDGLCSDSEHPDAWFEQAKTTAAKEAVVTCWSCPVRQLCADFAVERKIMDGVWGGYTEAMLRDLVKQRFPGHRARPLVAKQRRKRKPAA